MATDHDKQAERDEQQWSLGNQAAYRTMLATFLREMGCDVETQDSAVRTAARLTAERIDAIAALRRICEQHGDNDWDDDLYLADVIEKHLHRHLGE
jgi:predicted secreted protein